MPSPVQTVVDLAITAISKLPSGQAAIIGVSGCQGSGKTYTSQGAVAELTKRGITAVAISIDDYYLDYNQQVQLAANGNKLLQKRGLPGTHLVDDLLGTLHALQQGKQAVVLQYDKSAHSGMGDRSPSKEYGPVEAIILEGWMVGFEPLGRQLEQVYDASTHAKKYSFKDIQQVDAYLEHYQAVWSCIQKLVLLRAEKLEYVYKWRLQQEHTLVAATGHGMTDAQIVEFVDGYMPAYELYLGGVKPHVEITLDIDRNASTMIVA